MKQIKNVLLITKEFQCDFQQKVGGTGVFYKNLAEALAQKNINVFVFGSAKKSFEFQQENLTVHFVKNYFNKYKLIEFLRSITGKISFLENVHFKLYDWETKYLENELKKFIQNKEIDIAETHDWEGVSIITENLKIPYCVRAHGSWSLLSKFFSYGAAKGKIYREKQALQKAKNIIVVSKNNEEMMREIFGNKNYHLIYNGIDTDFYRPVSEIKMIPKSIFFLGNVSKEKGAKIALDSFIKINKQEPNATLHFVGKETELTDELKKKVSSNNLEGKVIFYGKKTPEEVKKLISQAEVVIFPSKGETFGLALAEVMAMQKPVVCSNLEAFKEIVENGRNCYIAESEDDFVEKIMVLFSDNNFTSNLSTNARKTIIDKFSLEKMVENTLNYYSDIIN